MISSIIFILLSFLALKIVDADLIALITVVKEKFINEAHNVPPITITIAVGCKSRLRVLFSKLGANKNIKIARINEITIEKFIFV